MYNANSPPCKTKLIASWKPLFNKTISNFETKPYEILQDNIEFLQNELRSKDETIKTLMETQAAVLENLPLSKSPQETENNPSFQKDVNQLNINTVFKGQANQEYNNRSQHHVASCSIKNPVKSRTVTIIKILDKKRDSVLAIMIRMLKSKTLSSFLVSMQPHTRRKIVVLTYRLGKMGKIKGLDSQ